MSFQTGLMTRRRFLSVFCEDSRIFSLRGIFSFYNYRMHKRFFFLLVTPWLAAFTPITPFGVYEEDHRLDFYEMEAPFQTMSDSVVAIIPHKFLDERGNRFVVDLQKAKNDLNLCPEERYREQPVIADCSGTLIGDDLVLTAGHCLSKKDCQQNYFVFGYQMNSSDTQITEFPSQDVYNCKEIIARKKSNTLDYAIIRLDRPVENRTPMKLAQRNASFGQDIFMLGYPSGLPLKYSGIAKVSEQKPDFFVSKIDAFGGNSGSGVFSLETNEIVGILVRGEEDYDYDRKRQCYKVHVCRDHTCQGEEITNIEPILRAFRP